MAYLAKNNAYSTLAGSVSNVATSLTVQTGHGDRFPVIAGADHTLVTLEDSGGNREIVKVTARSAAADLMTIERAQEGTTARNWLAGDSVELRMTAALVQDAMGHLTDATDAHDASAISYAGSAGLSATDVEAALDELDSEKAATGHTHTGVYQPASANLDEYAAVNPTAAGLALLDDVDAAAQRTTLGLGDAATKNTGTAAGTVAAGDHAHAGVYEPADANIAKKNAANSWTLEQTFKEVTQTVYAITDGAAFEIDPANGGFQTITLGASRTPKATNFAAGQEVILLVDDGTAFTLTWTDATFGGSGVVWENGSAPTLNTTGYTVITLKKVGSQVYGSYATASGAVMQGTAVAATSGTSIDFTGIPADTKWIKLSLAGVSMNASFNPLVRVGDAGGVEATGYVSGTSDTGGHNAFTDGFNLHRASPTATWAFSGSIEFVLLDATSNTWVGYGQFWVEGDVKTEIVTGYKATTAVLDRVRLTSATGTPTFDGGTVNIQYGK
jgi:hypothetical protein